NSCYPHQNRSSYKGMQNGFLWCLSVNNPAVLPQEEKKSFSMRKTSECTISKGLATALLKTRGGF
ncbi:MAG: hypothetical protein SOR92_03950, partial [Christensenella hongkongensis]|uniref:hypothetical protein n=1 Tax=Christensenella hongkongensis TaxID=270498 RepID=UPI002A75C864